MNPCLRSAASKNHFRPCDWWGVQGGDWSELVFHEENKILQSVGPIQFQTFFYSLRKCDLGGRSSKEPVRTITYPYCRVDSSGYWSRHSSPRKQTKMLFGHSCLFDCFIDARDGSGRASMKRLQDEHPFFFHRCAHRWTKIQGESSVLTPLRH